MLNWTLEFLRKENEALEKKTLSYTHQSGIQTEQQQSENKNEQTFFNVFSFKNTYFTLNMMCIHNHKGIIGVQKSSPYHTLFSIFYFDLKFVWLALFRVFVVQRILKFFFWAFSLKQSCGNRNAQSQN